MKKGIFGGLFDLNRDGKLDSLERAAEFAFLDHLAKQESERRQSANAPSSSTLRKRNHLDAKRDDLFFAGLDEDTLSEMDPEERASVLEDAFLDPSDYDYLED